MSLWTFSFRWHDISNVTKRSRDLNNNGPPPEIFPFVDRCLTGALPVSVKSLISGLSDGKSTTSIHLSGPGDDSRSLLQVLPFHRSNQSSTRHEFKLSSRRPSKHWDSFWNFVSPKAKVSSSATSLTARIVLNKRANL